VSGLSRGWSCTAFARLDKLFPVVIRFSLPVRLSRFRSFLHTPLIVQKLDEPDFVDGTRHQTCPDSAHFKYAFKI
jgi:hypothetical protein